MEKRKRRTDTTYVFQFTTINKKPTRRGEKGKEKRGRKCVDHDQIQSYFPAVLPTSFNFPVSFPPFSLPLHTFSEAFFSHSFASYFICILHAFLTFCGFTIFVALACNSSASHSHDWKWRKISRIASLYTFSSPLTAHTFWIHTSYCIFSHFSSNAIQTSDSWRNQPPFLGRIRYADLLSFVAFL